MTHRHALLAFLTSIALVATSPLAFAVDKSVTVSLGDGTVLLPVLPGFADPSATPQPIRELMARSMPATNRFVALMPMQDFLDRRAAGEPAAMSRYMMVQTVRAHEQNGVSRAEFERIKAMLRQQSDAMAREGAKQAQDGIDLAAKEVGRMNGDSQLALKAGVPRSLGVFDETPDSISLAQVTPITRTDQNGVRTVYQASAMSIVLVRDKPVSAIVYSAYQSQADVDWTEREVLDWVKRYTALNAGAVSR
jgi:hypothetical protein